MVAVLDKNGRFSEHFSAFVVIPAEVFFDKTLPDKSKMLYGLISNMCNQSNYCWARNTTLARYLGVTEDKSVRRHLSALKERGYIEVEQTNEGGSTVRKIRIKVGAQMQNRPVKNDLPPGQKRPPRPVKNDRQNNININNIPPIAPLEGCNDCASANADASATVEPSKKSRPRQKTGEPVELSPEAEQRFTAFWDAYPVHKDRQRTRLRWAQIAPTDALLAEILEAIAKLKQSDDWQRDIIPLPSTFLRNRRWEDAEDLPDTPQQVGGINRW